MIGLAHFLQFIGLGLGFVALYICLSQYKKSRQKFLLVYMVLLAGINFLVFIHVLEAFFKTIMSSEAYDESLRNPFLQLIFFLAPVRLFMAAKSVQLAQIYRSRKFSWRFYGYPLAYFLLFSFLIFLDKPIDIANVLGPWLVFSVHFLLFLSMIYLALQMLLKKPDNPVFRKDYTLGFAWMILIYAVLTLALRLINTPYQRIHEDIQMLGLGITDTLFNLANIFILGRMLKTSDPVNKGDINSLQDLFEKYGISPREQEVVLLICKGKTNKEIAEELFISPITVRDHNSNIYRKTGVKNRTQLAGLFQNLS